MVLIVHGNSMKIMFLMFHFPVISFSFCCVYAHEFIF